MNCTPWSDEQWKERSRPAKANSEFELKDTRYNAQGVAVHTYREDDGWYYAVLPGMGNRFMFDPEDYCGEDGVRARAVECLVERGFTLTEPPTASELPLANLVENRA